MVYSSQILLGSFLARRQFAEQLELLGIPNNLQVIFHHLTENFVPYVFLDDFSDNSFCDFFSIIYNDILANF